MNTIISDYPNSYLTVSFNDGEKIIIERGAMVYVDGNYELTTRFEAKKLNNWLGRFFGGKSIAYNVYKSIGDTKIIFSPDENAEIFEVPITDDKPIIIEPSSHFARVGEISLKIIRKDWKTTLNDGLKMEVTGNGSIFLVGYGKIIKQKLEEGRDYLVDEEYLVAYDKHLDVKMTSRGFKELIKSGEGYLYKIRGIGDTWIQTRQRHEMSSKGGIISNILDIFRF